MSADHDGDSQMMSSPEASDMETPKHQIVDLNTISPPTSQSRNNAAMPLSTSGASVANSNGKRPLNTISNGTEDGEELASMANTKAKQDFPPKTHARSGYTWSRAEDEPGYSWLNAKAVDESARALDGLLHKDQMLKGRYGDVFDRVRAEQAALKGQVGR